MFGGGRRDSRPWEKSESQADGASPMGVSLYLLFTGRHGGSATDALLRRTRAVSDSRRQWSERWGLALDSYRRTSITRLASASWHLGASGVLPVSPLLSAEPEPFSQLSAPLATWTVPVATSSCLTCAAGEPLAEC